MANQFREAMQRMASQMRNAGGSGGSGGGGPGRAASALASSIMGLAGAGALAYGAYHSMYTVQGGHRAVVFNRIVGMKDTVYGEGLNFNIPWFEHPVIFDIRTRPVNLQTLTGSKDLQMVTLGIRVLHKPNAQQLVWIYRFLGVNYDERVLPSIMNECAKAVVARYNASELLTKRELVSKEISSELRKRAMNFNILLEVGTQTTRKDRDTLTHTHVKLHGGDDPCLELYMVILNFGNLYFSHRMLPLPIWPLVQNTPVPSKTSKWRSRIPNAPSTLCWERNRKRKQSLLEHVEKPNRPN